VLVRLIVPAAGAALFFLLSTLTVRGLRPRQPRRYFLSYALLLLVAAAGVYQALWPIVRLEDMVGLVSDLLLQLLACLTMWNMFYSLLWGFSGGLMFDLFNDEGLRNRDRLIRSYAGTGDIDRMLARRLPNLVRGGWVVRDGNTLRLTSKGRLMARGTRVAYAVFSLGAGGGVK